MQKRFNNLPPAPRNIPLSIKLSVFFGSTQSLLGWFILCFGIVLLLFLGVNVGRQPFSVCIKGVGVRQMPFGSYHASFMYSASRVNMHTIEY